ncbi:MAG: lmo0937 family membrane protein [Ferruginibacter sp.]
MRNITYLVASVLILGWAIGFFALHLGSSVHLVLVFALMLLVLRVVQGKKEEDAHE